MTTNQSELTRKALVDNLEKIGGDSSGHSHRIYGNSISSFTEGGASAGIAFKKHLNERKNPNMK